MTISLVLLSLALSGVLCWENLPAIPAGRRAEYYLLHDDGGYKYGYDTGTGQSAVVSADPSNQVQGQYQYLDKGGRKVSLSYTAGNTGFVPQLQAGSSGPSYGSGTPSFDAVSHGSSTVDADYDANSDASYSFNIDTDSYKRTETSDAKGNIQGRYSYSSPAGGSHSLNYVAGEGTGFIVTGGDSNAISVSPNSAFTPLGSTSNNAYVPPAPFNNAYNSPAAASYSGAPVSDANSKINNDGSYSFSYNAGDHSRQESADTQNNVRGSYSFTAKDDGQTRRVDYTAGSSTGFVAHGSHLPVPPSVPSATTSLSAPSTSLGHSTVGKIASSYSATGPQSDGSYTFSYDAGDHSRQETGDSQNNVRGTFSFKAKDDGQTRRVDYQAGAATGFVAKGAHLPVAPSAAPGGAGYQGNYGSAVSGGYDLQGVAVNAYSGTGSGEENPSGDASYSFSFNAGDHSRQETSDAQGNIQGQFSFLASDGIQRKVDYTAGAGQGFVANGAHLPNAPGIPESPSALGYAPVSPPAQFSNIPATALPTTASTYQNPTTAYRATGLQDDGSYTFSYQTPDHGHQQSGDAKNNVRGSYSFKAKDDGLTRRVDYEAGAATGFVAKGAHLPVAPPLPSGYSSSANHISNNYSGSASNALAKSSDSTGDGSYSFSYDAGDHSREESSDSQGNIHGRFSFTAKDDGQRRLVEYEAGAEKGFVAKGSHIPVADAGTSASGYHSSSYQAPSTYQALAVDDGQGIGDGSYSYTYKTDSSSKQESADAQGNVVGSFSFVGGDGVSRSVQYSSKGDEGFIASGAHLPTVGLGVQGANGLVAGHTGYSSVAGHSGTKTSHAKATDINTREFRLQKYLPPESHKKFGYIFDSKV